MGSIRQTGKDQAARDAAAAAQGDATQALANAATADGKAVAAQGDATQALADAAAAVEVIASAVFSVSGGVLTVHAASGMTLTRAGAGLFDFSFTTPQPDALWRTAVNHVRSSNFLDSGNQVISQTLNGGRLMTFEQNSATDVAPSTAGYSSITVFKK